MVQPRIPNGILPFFEQGSKLSGSELDYRVAATELFIHVADYLHVHIG